MNQTIEQVTWKARVKIIRKKPHSKNDSFEDSFTIASRLVKYNFQTDLFVHIVTNTLQTLEIMITSSHTQTQ